MNHFLIAFLFFLSCFNLYGQDDVVGQWNGLLIVQGIQLRVVFNISKTENGFVATMDSPDQGAKDIPVTSTIFEFPTIKLQVANAQIEYIGTLSENIITGTFKQGGQEFPMNLTKEKVDKKALSRPQEPTQPYNYYTENVAFRNYESNITLAGTLSLPAQEGKYPIAILISGSGPQNRDSEVFGHRPFLVISDYLTKKGIGVLRYDDRGVGQSEGDFGLATSVNFASDVLSAVAYLKTRDDVDPKKIGLIGHSEGGIIAPMAASKSGDIGFIVLLAAPGIRGDKLLLKQQEMMAKASGVDEEDIRDSQKINAKIFEMVLLSKDHTSLQDELKEYIRKTLQNKPKFKPEGISNDEFMRLLVSQIVNPWMIYFLEYDPAPTIREVKCPVLALNGKKDLQVPSNENLKAIKKALKKGKNRNVTVHEVEGLNHLFQECSTGLPNEYGQIEETFSPIVLAEIADWITIRVK